MGFNLNKTNTQQANAGPSKAHPLAHIDHSLADYEREMKERDALMKQVEAPDLVEYVRSPPKFIINLGLRVQ